MPTIKAHFDGRVIVPDQPVDLLQGQELVVHFEPARAENGPAKNGEPTPSELDSADAWIDEHAVDDPSLPIDGARQHDHYLYGTPKRT
ncbi:MAG TPA: hypothetical protein VK797_26410 [Tepidisphaeraceae bacterium]|nr:hypothetical protein [Tepidisphaeraceae bacterium]